MVMQLNEDDRQAVVEFIQKALEEDEEILELLR